LVDAGCGRAQPQLLDNIRACGVDPEQIEYLLLSLEADVLCEGHYGIYRGKPAVAAFIRQFL